MKRCPYCAEEIQDEAIKCRWCMSWLTDDVPAGAEKAAAAGVLEPSPASEPATEPTSEPATEPTSEPATEQTPTGAEAPPTAVSSSPPSSEGVSFTHTGSRYVLGYASDYFAIWDRSSPSSPVHRFPRTNEGWQAAWVQFTSIESNFVEVAKDS